MSFLQSNRFVKRRYAMVGGSLLLLAFSMTAAVLLGSGPVSLLRAVTEPQSLDHDLLLTARLPRVALAALAGGGLSVVGTAFQALMRNPLAEPYVLGVSGGAALGASIAIALGLATASVAGLALIPLCAFAGGFATTAIVYAIARSSKGEPASGATILLAGIIVNTIAGALITFLKTLLSAAKTQDLLFWLMGFIDVPSPSVLLIIGTYVLGGGAVLFLESGHMNLLALGEEPAAHLGVDLRHTELRIFFASSAVVGAIVSVTGLIGFVGLIIPHILRRLCGPDHRILIPLSLINGGALLVLCDLGARVLFRYLGTEPPVGAITAVLGGPLFLVMLSHKSISVRS